MKKILVLEDETSIRSFIVINLNRAGYEVIEAGTGAEAFEQLRQHPDIKVAILDVMLPDTDGYEVCRTIRTKDPHIGIVMLTAKTQELDIITGLSTGADKYITKPFSLPVLTAEIDALFKRIGASDPVDTGEIIQGPFRLNKKNKSLEKDGVRIKITLPIEYDIIKMFMDNPGKAFSRDDILKTVWKRDHFDPKVVDVTIRRLRIKIEDDPANPTYILTVWGYGYEWGL